MFRLTKISVMNRSVVLLACLALLALGAYVVPQLHQELFPPLNYPTISVLSIYPGASPTQVEQDVTNPLEQSFRGDAGVQQINSVSREGVSTITLQYDFGTDLDKAQQTLQQQVNREQSLLPGGVSPQIQQYNIADAPIIYLSASSSESQSALALAIKQTMVPAVQAIPGVANVDVTGVRNQIVTVTLDLNKLHDRSLSIFQVLQALQANNWAVPTGEVTSQGKTYPVQIANAVGSIQELTTVVVGEQQLTNGSFAPVKLSDVATVKEDLAPSTILTRTNGIPGLGISITKAATGNAISISQALTAQIPQLEKLLGHNAKITVTSDQAPAIQSSIGDLAREGLLGAGFAVLVILLFLLSIRSTLVTAISIPLSVVIALIGLWTQGYSLNLLTLSGLTIAIGRVVDDSIVVLENIYRRVQGGDDTLSAVLSGTKEVATAVTASTLTTVAVFLPLAFIGGITGEYTHPLALTVTIALLASLLVALTIVPVLAYWFLKTPGETAKQTNIEQKQHILEKVYVPIIHWATGHRAITLVLAILLLCGSFALFPFLPINAFGSQGVSNFSFSLTLPVNTSLDQTSEAVRGIENVLAYTHGVQNYQVTIGTSNSIFLSGGGSNVANFTVSTTPDANFAEVQQSVQTQVKHLAANDGTLNFSSQGSGNSVDVTVQAGDTQTLDLAAQQVYNTLASTPNTSNITTDLAKSASFIDVRVDSQKALAYGLNPDWVGEQLKMIYTGTTATQVTLNGVQQDVDLKINASANTIQQMRDMLVQGTATNGTIENVHLGDIATISLDNGPTQIAHFNGLRTATITLTVSGKNVGAVNVEVQKRLSRLTLPNGATAALGASAVKQSQTLTQLYVVLLAAIVLVFIVMVAIFHSLIQPLLLLVAIPFAFSGSIVFSVLTQTAIGISSLFGALMLVGIVVTNAIVLIDLVNRYRARGMDAHTAVIEGGRHRVRPILMTAIATVMALIPLASGVGASTSGAVASNMVISGGLAIVVIGGLVSSTLLTLLLVPVLYTLVEDIRDRFRIQPSTVVEHEKGRTRTP